jgi:hypothetical protein
LYQENIPGFTWFLFIHLQHTGNQPTKLVKKMQFRGCLDSIVSPLEYLNEAVISPQERKKIEPSRELMALGFISNTGIYEDLPLLFVQSTSLRDMPISLLMPKVLFRAQLRGFAPTSPPGALMLDLEDEDMYCKITLIDEEHKDITEEDIRKPQFQNAHIFHVNKLLTVFYACTSPLPESSTRLPSEPEHTYFQIFGGGDNAWDSRLKPHVTRRVPKEGAEHEVMKDLHKNIMQCSKSMFISQYHQKPLDNILYHELPTILHNFDIFLGYVGAQIAEIFRLNNFNHHFIEERFL